jgi:pilus assembly protein CpaB
MRSKVLIIVLALVLGGLAAVFAATYLRSARTDIAAQNESVEVLVATQDLPRGLTAEELVQKKLVVTRRVPRQFVSADAISSMRGVQDQVLAVPVGTGEQITKTRFSYPQDAGLAYSVPQDLVAMSAEVDEVGGVAGLLKPGDYVIVYATLKGGARRGDQTARTIVLIPRTRVLAVGNKIGVESSASLAEEQQQNSSGGALSGRGNNGQSNIPKTVTLALTTQEAAQLTFAQEEGTTRLALLPASGSKLTMPAPITLTSVGK